MLQYEKAAVSNSAFKRDVVYYYDVKEKERGDREREMSGYQHRERERERASERDCFITIRGDEFASQRNGDQLMKLYRS